MNELPKHKRLCGQVRISRLYKEGKRFVAWPMRVTWMPAEEGRQVMVWAPKSLFKHAVDRNRLRRLMREAYRLHQPAEEVRPCIIAFNYIDKEIQPYSVIEKAVVKALKRIKNDE